MYGVLVLQFCQSMNIEAIYVCYIFKPLQSQGVINVILALHSVSQPSCNVIDLLFAFEQCLLKKSGYCNVGFYSHYFCTIVVCFYTII